MVPSNTLTLGAAALASAFARREISPRDYGTLWTQRCDMESGLGAYISRDPDLALRTTGSGPLAHVPIAIKDNIDTVDLATTGGTPALKGNRPPRNAPVINRLLAAGATIAGKLNMHELAYGGTNDNVAFGRALNPVDRTRTAGGSSGGSAVAVAAHLAPAALGSDTAGSVRVPAALTGIFGLRPTLGRYPGMGVVPIAHSRDTVGPLARSLNDIALLDAVLAGDATAVAPPPVRSLRIGIDRDRFFGGVAPAVLDAIHTLIDSWRRAGVTIVDATISRDLATYQFVTSTIIEYEYVPDFEAYLAASAPRVGFADVMAQAASPILRTRLAERWERRGRTSAADYAKALGPDLTALRAAYAGAFARHGLNAILMPATQDVALPFAGDDDVLRNGASVSSWFYFRNTAHATILGAPSLAIPAGRDAAGLPVGALLDGLPGRDRDLIAVATALHSIARDRTRPTR